MAQKLLTYHGGRGAATTITVLGTKHNLSTLAESTGYSISHLSRVLRRKHGVSDDCLTKLARSLQVKKVVLAALLAGKQPPTQEAATS